MVMGFLFFVLYFGNLAVPLLHHLEVSRNSQRLPASGRVVLQAHQVGFTHDRAHCAICQNSLYNHYFQFFRPLLYLDAQPPYCEPIIRSASALLQRYVISGRPRAPPVS